MQAFQQLCTSSEVRIAGRNVPQSLSALFYAVYTLGAIDRILGTVPSNGLHETVKSFRAPEIKPLNIAQTDAQIGQLKVGHSTVVELKRNQVDTARRFLGIYMLNAFFFGEEV
jgi:hypothetical protein